jgi:WD40 repeat protein
MQTQIQTGPAATATPAKILTSFRGHTGAVAALAFSPDRCLLASGDRTGAGRIWDVASGKPGERAFRVSDSVRALTFAPNGRMLAAGSATGTVSLFDVSDKGAVEIRALRGGQKPIDALAFSPDGKLVAGAGEDQTLRVWEPGAATGSEARTLLPGHT